MKFAIVIVLLFTLTAKGVIQNYALPFSSVINTGLFASLRASDTGLMP
jgi:hypothetical protein